MVRGGLIIFDDGLGQLGPMTDLRASFEVRSGMVTTAGRLAGQWPGALAGYWVPPRLEAVVGERAGAAVNRLPDGDDFFCVNGRWALPDAGFDLQTGQAACEESSGQVVAARLRRGDAERFLTGGELPDHVETSSRN